MTFLGSENNETTNRIATFLRELEFVLEPGESAQWSQIRKHVGSCPELSHQNLPPLPVDLDGESDRSLGEGRTVILLSCRPCTARFT